MLLMFQVLLIIYSAKKILDEMVNGDFNLDKENPMTEDAFRQTAFSILNVIFFYMEEKLKILGFS